MTWYNKAIARAVHSLHPLPADRRCGLSEDRATDAGIMHKKLVKIARVVPEISSRTYRQTDIRVLITILRNRSRAGEVATWSDDFDYSRYENFVDLACGLPTVFNLTEFDMILSAARFLCDNSFSVNLKCFLVSTLFCYFAFIVAK